MSLRWSSYVALKPPPPKGGSKTQNGRFLSKMALRLKEVCYKVFFLCEICQRQSCNAFIVLTILARMVGGGRPLLPDILDQTDRVKAKSPIFDLFARSDSAVTPSEKSSINTNTKSTTRFPMSLRWTSYVVPKPPKGGWKTQNVQNFNNKLQ